MNPNPVTPRDMDYGDYLGLDGLLECARPVSDNHDELLFIIQHQTSELWMKLAIHELRAARACIAADDLDRAMKMLARVTRIFEQLLSAWSVLATMTPSEYTQLRDHLGSSSGFQSWQYRQIEFILGNASARMLAPHEHRPAEHQTLRRELHTPSLYDEVLRLAVRRGLDVPDEVLTRDVTQKYEPHDGVEAMWTRVYRDPTGQWELYYVAEKLVDLEDMFRQWRFRHLTTVERIIGFKRGTGGTSGVGYLKAMLDVVVFPELWSVRGAL